MGVVGWGVGTGTIPLPGKLGRLLGVAAAGEGEEEEGEWEEELDDDEDEVVIEI